MIWFKHPNDLPNDKRLASLIDNEGCRGYGMYLRIIEMLCAQPDRKLSFSQLNIISRKGFSRKYMEKIIWEYKLFTIHEEEFESAINFNNMERGNHSQNNLKTPEKTEDAKNGDNPLNNSGSRSKTGLARVREEQNREEQMKRKDDDVVPKNGGGVTPYQSWRKQVDGLSKNQLFREMVCMRSGYSVLHASIWIKFNASFQICVDSSRVLSKSHPGNSASRFFSAPSGSTTDKATFT